MGASQVLMVPLREILVKDRGRKDFGDVQSLADDIEQVGLIHPVLVMKAPEGSKKKYQLIAGERRYRAHILLGRTEIEVRLREDFPPGEQGDLLYRCIELSENVARQQLSAIEHMEMVAKIHELRTQLHGPGSSPEGWTLKKTADEVGLKSAGQVSTELKYARILENRGDIRERVKGLPRNAIISEIDKILLAEKNNRLIDEGKLVVTTNFQHSDVRDFIKTIPDGSVQLILTDPPYGIDTIQNEVDKSGDTKNYIGRVKPTDNLSQNDAANLLQQVLPEFARILAPGGHIYIFGSNELLTSIERVAPGLGLVMQPERLIWFKEKTSAPFLGYRYSPCYESILFLSKPMPDTKYCRKLLRPCKTVLSYPQADNSIHPFEKPLPLLKALIENSTHRGETVFDGFAGSGAILHAATELGRKAIGCELDAEHFANAAARLSALKTSIQAA